MPHLAVACILFVLGTLAMVTSWGNSAAEFLMLNDPLVVQLGAYLYENEHTSLANLHERLVTLFGMPHHAFVTGFVFGAILGKRYATVGVAFWLGYATAFTATAAYFQPNMLEALSGSLMFWCYVPCYVLGVVLPGYVSSPSLPRFSLFGIITFVSVCSLVSSCVLHSLDWGIRMLVLLVLSYAAFNSFMVANNAMHDQSPRHA